MQTSLWEKKEVHHEYIPVYMKIQPEVFFGQTANT